MYAGLALATCVGLFLFTRIQIPDVTITATIALALWAFLRALDPEEARPGVWSAVMAAAIGTGLLLKGLIAAVFPIAAMLLFLAFTGEWQSREAWRRLHVFRGILHRSGDRRALAHSGHAAESAVFRFHDAQRRRASIAASSGSIFSTSTCCAF